MQRGTLRRIPESLGHVYELKQCEFGVRDFWEDCGPLCVCVCVCIEIGSLSILSIFLVFLVFLVSVASNSGLLHTLACVLRLYQNLCVSYYYCNVCVYMCISTRMCV